MSEDRKKRLIHRACYRGIKEMDLILGGFAKAYALNFTDTEVEQFEALLDEKDHDIYDWISGVAQIPNRHDTPLFSRLKKFIPEY